MKHEMYWNEVRGLWVLPVPMGECRTSSDPRAILSTMLGSCVAACVFDPARKIGGMNHILLPTTQFDNPEQASRFGCFAMETLVNSVMRWGGRRSELRVKLFGGARTLQSGADIGARNVEWVRRYLELEQMKLVSSDVGGGWARRVEFFPTTGRVRVLRLENTERLRRRDRKRRQRLSHPPTDAGIELF